MVGKPARRPHRFSIAGSTIFLMAATFASTLAGFAREIVSAKYYGTRWEMDTFLAAATIPTILFGVFNGALVSALVPVFSEYVTHGREDEAWRLGSTALNLLAITLTVLAAIGYFAAPYYVPVI
ncbi:MAG TPA: lipid II flippase MurJ, partial [Candidatus Acidoferrales bacterium]|nr:lipid II flippase MurJ [Candidatus Acidoferrales bacterium]